MMDENKQKLEMIYIKLNALGWRARIEHYDDGLIMAYCFTLSDRLNDGCYWEVVIEDHHDELDMPEPLDDWLIHASYHDPDQKDWYGHNYTGGAAIEFKTMKLLMEFIEILESERLQVKNNPIAYLRENANLRKEESNA